MSAALVGVLTVLVLVFLSIVLVVLLVDLVLAAWPLAIVVAVVGVVVLVRAAHARGRRAIEAEELQAQIAADKARPREKDERV